MTTKYDNSNSNWSFATRSVHAGQNLDGHHNARNVPIYQTTSYVFNDAEHAANRFNLSDAGPIYTRLTNPTQDALEERLASLEGGVAAVAFASGQAAETAAILNLASAGDHIVTSPRLYGGTSTLFTVTFKRLGIDVTLVENPDDPQSWQDAVQPNTKAFYGETFGNPVADVLDIPAIAEVAHNNQVPLIVDNTIATAALARPLDLGADIVVVSTTKFYTGNGSAIGGAIIDGGSFDWTVTRNGEPVFPYFVTPDEAYHGLKYADLGAPAFALKARAGLLRDTGAAISPFNAWLTLNGIETVGLRVEKHNANAQAVAEYLEGHAKVTKVNYAGLDSSPYKATKENSATPTPAPCFPSTSMAAARKPGRLSTPSSSTPTSPISATPAPWPYTQQPPRTPSPTSLRLLLPASPSPPSAYPWASSTSMTSSRTSSWALTRWHEAS